MSRTAIPLLVAALSAAACGTEDPEGALGDYYPMEVGRSWTYQETDDGGQTSVFHRDIEALETIDLGYGDGPQQVYKVVNTYEGSNKRNEYYTTADGDRSSRLRTIKYRDDGSLKWQRDYTPGFLRFDRSKLTAGTSWPEAFQMYQSDDVSTTGPLALTYNFEVVSLDEEVQVPAGTFRCVVLKRTPPQSDPEFELFKRYYFAEGVGEVKEELIGQGYVWYEEVLVDWNTGND